MAKEQDVQAVMEGVAEAFSRLDVDRWLSYFNPQHTFVHHDSVFVAHSLDETKAAFAPMIAELKESGFRRSALDRCSIKFPGAKMAVAATLWRRLGEDDKLLEAFGATYTLLDTPAGWKIVVAAVHDNELLFD
ncbi:MAG: nuclear transport factor 2 family protein [Gammaproteobacteria bacterium]